MTDLDAKRRAWEGRLERVPHRHGFLGWSYNTHRRRRWCRFCGFQQRWDESAGRWFDA